MDTLPTLGRREVLERALKIAETYEPVKRFSSFFEDEDGSVLTLPTIGRADEYNGIVNPTAPEQVCKVCLTGCTYLAGWQLLVEKGANTNGTTLTHAISTINELGVGYAGLLDYSSTFHNEDDKFIDDEELDVRDGRPAIEAITMQGLMASFFRMLLEEDLSVA